VALTSIVPLFVIPPEIVLAKTTMAAPDLTLSKPVFVTPPPTELPLIEIPSVPTPMTTCLLAVIVPAFETAPITVELAITIEVVEWPAGLVTVMTV
jgi:hypothetical protein